MNDMFDSSPVLPEMPIEICGDGKYIETKVIDGKICFTFHPAFIKRIEIIEDLLGGQIPLVHNLKNELWKLIYENRSD